MKLDKIAQHLDSLTKPPGSLGRLEELAARLCQVQQSLRPATRPRRLLVFAGDHGVVAEGVTAWPSDVTGLMIKNILSGGAACSVLARTTETELVLVDVGAQSMPLSPQAGYVVAKIRRGTRNLAREPALNAEEFEQAWEVGAAQARQAAAEGMRVVAAGDMGIGNTTPASCLAVLLAGVTVNEAVGRGAGADDATLVRKRAVVEAAVQRIRPNSDVDPKAAIAAVNGLEIAAMAGFFATAAKAGLTVVLDGFIATSAALVAEALVPETRQSMIAAHCSAEPGHKKMLATLELTPFLDTWQLRLGEGTGALLLMPLLDAAASVVCDMATFDRAGIPTS
jgi:nicotinate-nucleotide--dimethylbenzimidazole phosphoribosyltransferase